MASARNLFLILATVAASCDGATILALFSTLSYSEHLIFRGYVELLAKRQHHVVVMTPFPGNFQFPEIEYITEVDVSEASAPFAAEFRNIMSTAYDYLSVLPSLNELSIRVAVAQLRSQQMSSILVNPNVKFDLIITEADMPLLYAFAEKYNAPHIAITASHGKINMYDSKGNPNHPLLYPDVYSLDYGKLNIWKKMREVSRHLRYRYEYYWRYLPACQQAASRVLKTKRELQQLEYEVDLLLVSGTHMLLGNRPTVPAILYVDRLHIKPGLPLDQDVKSVLDASKRGAVYFSLGALQSVRRFPPATLKALTAMLGELPYTVLWSIDNSTGLALPDNVLALDWFMQQEVLAHPNVKAFITHGGPRSLEEAVYYEVPVVVLPTAAGARVFAERVTSFGTGLIVDPSYAASQQMKAAVLQVAGNYTYKEAMSKLKQLAFDQPMSGAERAVWWTEYVLRHGGAAHLRAPAVGVPLYKYFMLDVLAILAAALVVALMASYTVVRKLLNCRHRSQQPTKLKMP